MSHRIRLANESDAAPLHSLLQKAYAPLLEHNIHFTITRASVEDVRQVIRSETTYVLETDAGLTATLTTRFQWTPAKIIWRPGLSFTGLPSPNMPKGKAMAARLSATWKKHFCAIR